MYKCLNCGAEFETPEVEVKYFNGEIDDHINICPECKIDDIEKMVECGMCRQTYIKSDQDRCEYCTERTDHWMENAILSISEETGAERDEIIKAMVVWIEEQ